MCGIAGILNFNNSSPDPSLIRAMNNCMQHRGPDAEAFYESGPIALGHRRLSIIDLSEAANQPMADASGRFWLVFNGEIYNFMEVKSKLPRSEEHTSELQSQSNLVCRLLLEKKKKKKKKRKQK